MPESLLIALLVCLYSFSLFMLACLTSTVGYLLAARKRNNEHPMGYYDPGSTMHMKCAICNAMNGDEDEEDGANVKFCPDGVIRCQACYDPLG